MDSATSNIRAVEFTPGREGDSPDLPDLLNQIPSDEYIDTVNADGAHEIRRCHSVIIASGATPFIPIRKNGRPWKEDCRSKGSKNKRPGMHEERMKDLILDEAYRDITIREGHRSVTIPMAQAVMRSLAVNAAKGQHRSQRLFSELLAEVESSRKILQDQWLDTAITYKVEWEKELHRRQQLGITDLPDPLPHPDHVKIDMIEGTAIIAGPATKEEKAEYDWFVERREMFEDELRHLKDLRAEAEDTRLINQIDEDIGQVRRILQIIDTKLPD